MAATPSWILEISIFDHVTVTGFNIWYSVPNFIKIGQFFTEIWRFYDFENGGRPSCWILKICIFCPVALVDLLFCFLVQNFAKIGQSVDDLWPTKRFSRWRPPPSWILKIQIFGHVTVTGFNIWCSVPNFIKIGQFFTEIWRFDDFQNGVRPPSWILHICIFCPVGPCQHAVLLPHTKFCWNWTIGRWFMAKKSIFKMAAAAILKFKNFNFWSCDCHGAQYLL